MTFALSERAENATFMPTVTTRKKLRCYIVKAFIYQLTVIGSKSKRICVNG